MKTLAKTGALALLGLLLSSAPARAYPEMIRLTYVQCQACHTSSNGSGLLNAYGKSVRASLAAFQRPEEQKLQEAAPSAWNANAFIRYLWIRSKSENESFLMQTDATGRYQKDQADGSYFAIQSTAGLVPERVRSAPNAPSGVLGKSFVLRQFYAEKSWQDRYRLVAGRDFLPRGLNVDDHTSFMRALNRQGVTDYPTQIRGELATEKNLLQVGAFGPSGEEDASGREWGGFARSEWTLAERASAGAQAIYGKSDAIGRLSLDAFARAALNEKLGILGDTQLVRRSLSNAPGDPSFNQWIGYLEPFYVPFEFLTLNYRYERFTVEDPFFSQGTRYSLTLDFKPISELSLIGSYERQKMGDRWGETLYLIQLYAEL